MRGVSGVSPFGEVAEIVGNRKRDVRQAQGDVVTLSAAGPATFGREQRRRHIQSAEQIPGRQRMNGGFTTFWPCD